MKTLSRTLVALCFGLFLAASSYAQSINQDVTINVQEINAISVSSGTVSLTITTATAGSDPDAVTDNTTSYNITTNASGMKLTGSLGSAFSSGLALAVTLGAPSGSTSQGQITLTTTAQELVTGIGGVAETGLSIAYEASATASVAAGTSETETVTITLTDV